MAGWNVTLEPSRRQLAGHRNRAGGAIDKLPGE